MISSGDAAAEMPKYRCHKEVHALKISGVTFTDHSNVELSFEYGFAEIIVNTDDTLFGFIPEEDADDNGYLVVYADGYRSWSPTKAFEEGYSRI